MHFNGNVREGAQERAIFVKSFLVQRSKNSGDVYDSESQPPSPLVGLGDCPVFFITFGYLVRFSKTRSRHGHGV